MCKVAVGIMMATWVAGMASSVSAGFVADPLHRKGAVALESACGNLTGRIDERGLWLDSAAAAGFRLGAVRLGREPATMRRLDPAGAVAMADGRVHWLRPGVREEYVVAPGGIRQDFVCLEAPPGEGALRIELGLVGAEFADVRAGGATIRLSGGQTLEYSRLRVWDDAGRVLTARMEPAGGGALAIVVDDAGATYPVRIDPTYATSGWNTLAGGLGNRYVGAMAASGYNMYVAGSFTNTYENLSVTRIARWSGTSWLALGSGFDADVRGVAVDGGTLYAGGVFTNSGGAAVGSKLARWSGSTWVGVGGIATEVQTVSVQSGILWCSGQSTTNFYVLRVVATNGSVSQYGPFNGRIRDILIDGANVYVAGDFTTMGASSYARIVKYNGSTWSGLGTGISGGGNVTTTVYALAKSGGMIFAGGVFSTAGGSPAANIAQWNGSSWSALGSGMNDSVRCLAVDGGGKLFAGGAFTQAGGITARRVAVWDGSTWQELAGGLNDSIVAMAYADLGNRVYMGGLATIAGGVTTSRYALAFYLPPVAPSGLSASAVSTSGFTANWSAAGYATEYWLDVSTNSAFNDYIPGYSSRSVGNATSVSVASSYPGVVHYYRVRAGNTGGISDSSSSGSQLLLPPPPPINTPDYPATATSFSARWSGLAGFTFTYWLDVSTSSSFSSYLPGYANRNAGTGLGFPVTGLVAGTCYYYRARQENAAGVSANSDVMSAWTAPPNPNANAASGITGNGFTANWSAATGATGYFLDVSTSSSFSSFVSGYNNLSVGNATSRSVTGLAEGSTYYYRVRAQNSGGPSGNSGAITATTVPAAPTANAATSISGSGFTANWSAATGATGYFLDVSTSSGFSSFVSGYNNLSVGNATSRSVTGLSEGTTYYYRVRAQNGGGTSGNSGTISTTTYAKPTVNSPTVTGIGQTSATLGANVANNGGTALTARGTVWGTGANPTGNAAAEGGTGTGTFSHSRTGLPAGTLIYYRGYAVNSVGTAYSAGGSFWTIPPNPTASAASGISDSGFTAHWSAATGATGYFLDVATDGGFSSFVPGYNNLSVGSASSWTVTWLAPGTTYYYRLRAHNSGGASGNSGTISVVTAPTAPTAGLATLVTASGFTANWSAVPGATAYLLDVATDGGFTSFVSGYNNLSVGNATSRSVTGLSQGTTYYYRVRAQNSGGTSGNSGAISTTTHAKPTVATPTVAAIAQTGATLGASVTANGGTALTARGTVWGTGANPTGNAAAEGGTGTGTFSHSRTGLPAGTLIYYRGYAVNSVGTAYSADGTFWTIPPNPVVSNPDLGGTLFIANWHEATGATNYFLDVSTNSEFSSYLAGYQNRSVGAVLRESVTSVQRGTVYYYRVRAQNSGGTSGNSATQSLKTYSLPAVVAPTVTAITQTSATLGGNITTNGGAPLFSRGTAWGTTMHPYPLANPLDEGGTASGMFSHSRTGLPAGTLIYFQAYAHGGGGDGVSTNATFWTIPPDPSAGPATGLTAYGFTANWSATTGATNYFLDVSTSSNFSSFVGGYQNLPVGNVLSWAVTGLAPGLTYHYRVQAQNSGGASGYSAPQSTTTLLALPTVTLPTVASIGQANATLGATVTANGGAALTARGTAWGASANPTTNPFAEGGTATGAFAHVRTGLPAGTLIYYRGYAVNSVGTAYSADGSFWTIPSNPSSLPATGITGSGFTANWSASTGATNYFLDVATDSGFTTFVSGYDNLSVGDATSRSVTGLEPGTVYYYRVRAQNGGGASANSSVITTTTFALPTVALPAVADITQTSATLGATVVSDGGTALTARGTMWGTAANPMENYAPEGNTGTGPFSHNRTGLPAGTLIYYRGLAVNLVGPGYSADGSFWTAPPNPESSAAEEISGNGFTANWSAATGATNYFLDVATDGGFASFVPGYQNLSAGNVTSYSVTGLTSQSTYYFRVRAQNSGGISGNSSIVQITTGVAIPTLASPTAVAITQTEAVLGATVTSPGAGELTERGTVWGTSANPTGNAQAEGSTGMGPFSHVQTGLPAGTLIYYRGYAENHLGRGYSADGSFWTVPLNPTASPAALIAGTEFTAKWIASKGATNYLLDVSSSSAFTNFVAGYSNRSVGKALSGSVTGLSSQVTYYYRVRAQNSGGISGNSAMMPVTTVAAIPTLASPTAVAIEQTEATLGATVTSAGDGDLTERGTMWGFTPNPTENRLENGAALGMFGHVRTHLPAGTWIYFRGYAMNPLGIGFSPDGRILTKPANPTALPASSISSNAFTANWIATTGATNYFLDVSTVNTFASYVAGYENLAVGNATARSVAGLSVGATYFYRVRAQNGAGTSGNSETIPATPATPGAPRLSQPTVVSIGQTEAVLGATVTSGGSGVLTERGTVWGTSANPTGNARAEGNPATGTFSHVRTGLPAGTLIYYRGYAKNSLSYLEYTADKTFWTVPANPTAKAATSILVAEFTANWNGSAGATNYLLDVSTAADFSNFVAGYEDRMVGGTPFCSVTGLISGVTYHCRVRAQNGSGTSGNSEVFQVTTLAVPTLSELTASFIGQSNATLGATVTANGGAPLTARGTVWGLNADPLENVRAENGKSLGAFSHVRDGLPAGTLIHYRGYAANVAGSGYTTNGTFWTRPAPPTAGPPAEVSTHSFRANWSLSAGATNYWLSVSPASDFNPSISGSLNLSVGNVASHTVTGLTMGQVYYYRVQAQNSAGTSGNSEMIATRTLAMPLLDNPTATQINQTTATLGATVTSPGGAPLTARGTVWGLSPDPTGNVAAAVGTATGSFSHARTELPAGTLIHYRGYADNHLGRGYSEGGTFWTIPANPTAAPATAIASAGFTANWSASTGADSYLLDVSPSSSFSPCLPGYDNRVVGKVTSLALFGLTPGVTYHYRVRAQNGAGTSGNSAVIAATTLTIPTLTTPTVVSIGQTTATLGATVTSDGGSPLMARGTVWGTSANPKGNGQAEGGTATGTFSFGRTELPAGTLIHYRGYATSGAGTGYSPGGTFWTIPPNPAARAATANSDAGFTANWSVSTGATNYLLDVSTEPDFSSFVAGYGSRTVGAELFCSVTGLSFGVTYYYRVRAQNSGGTSGYSAVIRGGTIGAPTLSDPTAISIGQSSAMLGATVTANGGAAVTERGTVWGTSANPTENGQAEGGTATGPFSHNRAGLPAGTLIYYRGYAANAVGTGYSVDGTFWSVPLNPTAKAASAIKGDEFTANWNASTGATNYLLEVSPENTFASYLPGYGSRTVGAGTFCSVTGLSSGATYCYRVRAQNSGGLSGHSEIIEIVTLRVPTLSQVAAYAIGQTTATLGATVTSDGGSAMTKWGTAWGTAPSQIGNEQTTVAGTGTFSQARTGLPAGTLIHYRAFAANGAGTGYSTNGTFWTIPANPTANAATAVSGTGFTANWNASKGADGYRLDVSTSSSFATFVPGYSNRMNTTAVTGLVSGATYYYRVRAQNSAGTSGNSEPITVRTLAAPTLSRPTVSNVTQTTATLGATVLSDGGLPVTAWGTVWGLSENPTTGSQTGGAPNLGVLAHVRTGLPPGTLIYFRAFAQNGAGTRYSDVDQFWTLPPVPIAKPASAMGQAFTANWEPSTGAAKYYLDVSRRNDFADFVCSNQPVGNATAWVVSGLSPGMYYYRVRAQNIAGGTSGNSATIAVTIYALPTLSTPTVSNVTQSSAELGAQIVKPGGAPVTERGTVWGLAPNPTGNVLAANASTPTFSHLRTSLPAGKLIYFRGYAVNAGGTDYSPDGMFRTLPPTPKANPATEITGRDFRANWDLPRGEWVSYLDVSTASTFTNFLLHFSNRLVNGKSCIVGEVSSEESMWSPPLKNGGTYYYRVRIADADGTKSAYSETIAVKLLALPTVKSPTVSNVTQTTAALGATVTANGGASILERGTVWGTAPNPTRNQLGCGSELGVFNHVRSGLPPGTLIYCRGYAVNSVGTSYSPDMTFSTIPLPPAPPTITHVVTHANGFMAYVSPNDIVGTAQLARDPDFLDLVGYEWPPFPIGYRLWSKNFVFGLLVENGLTEGRTYYLRVRATNPGGTGEYSAPKAFYLRHHRPWPLQ